MTHGEEACSPLPSPYTSLSFLPETSGSRYLISTVSCHWKVPRRRMPTPIASQSRRTGAPAPAMFRKQLQAVFCFVLGMTVSLFVLPGRLGRHGAWWGNVPHLVDRSDQSKAPSLRSSPSLSPPMPRPSGHFYDATPGQVYGRAPRLLIGVLSAPSHRKQRDTIRHSWFHISTKQSWEPWFIIAD